MPRTGRPGSTHRQKRELWHRWKAGQTLSEIGRALNMHAGSVHGVFAATGGVEPQALNKGVHNDQPFAMRRIVRSTGLLVVPCDHR